MTFIFLSAVIVLAALIYIVSSRRGNKLKHVETDFHAVRMDLGESEQFMKVLAEQHKNITKGAGSYWLIKNLKQGWGELRKTHNYLSGVSDKLISLVPAAQWIVDNYYLIDRETKFLRQNAKRDLYKRLPIVVEGEFRGYPRIYIAAREMIKCTGYYLDEEMIITLLRAYQSVTPLGFDELWAFLDMLKACIIENISGLSKFVVESMRIKVSADKAMDEVLDGIVSEENITVEFEKKFGDNQNICHPSYITHLLYRLKEAASDDEILKQWIIKRLEHQDSDLSIMINDEGQRQARLQVAMGTLVGSLREESALDFENMLDKVSLVEEILRNDPIGLYDKMDFNTRQDYQRQVQFVAIKAGVQEQEAARFAVEISRESKQKGEQLKKSHVGYYLIGKGIDELLKKLGSKKQTVQGARTGALYFSSIALISVLICFFTAWYTAKRVGSYNGIIILAVLASVIPAVSIASEIATFFVLRIVKPKKLPSMDFEEGIPDEFKTIVVMPVVLGTKEQVSKYIERLETYHLANLDKNLHFGILGDFKDSDNKESENDKDITSATAEGISMLNEKYGSNGTSFFLFCRQREWNEKQGCWMGRERKRGILEAFNSLIIGLDTGSFKITLGEKEKLSEFKYVITIDAGTELVRDSAKKLIGIMAHPLNMPIMNEKKTAVIDGYTIIQPRIGIRVASALSTHFSRIFSGQAGIDTYTPVVSDVYQDVFGRGTFAGKGIYDPRIFHEVMSPTIPENAILSHDLLEGCYVQCASAADVELMDDFPSNIASFFAREHRWIRGDWQLLPWLFASSPLSGLSRYKIADNLRRSLIPVTHIILVFLALTLFSWQFYVWGTLVLFTTIFPLLIHVSKTTVLGFEKYGSGFNIINHLKNIILTLVQGLIWFMILPFRAYTALDAIIRTLYRVFISKKRMLEWKTAESVERSLTNGFSSYLRRMWINPVLGAILPVVTRQEYFIYASFVGVLWLASPYLCYRISQLLKLDNSNVSSSEISDLRIIARKTWRFFDEFFSEEDNWLIPDNYQEWPENGIAHRTSTTNIGLQLLSILSARDFGYIGTKDMVDRIDKIFITLNKLEKWNGHFYNWYDTRTLDVLIPKYVSTVDSGNFIGCLIALKNGLFEIKDKPLFYNLTLGLKDNLKLAGVGSDFKEPQNIDELSSVLEKILAGLEEENDPENMCADFLKKSCQDLLKEIGAYKGDAVNLEASLNDLLRLGLPEAELLSQRIDKLINQIDEIVATINFKPLFDKKRGIFRIGYNVTSGTGDNSFYDLLASEARLASFIAIAKGDIHQKHWFKLGRMLTMVHGNPTLVSWSGTMFEYLMPNLLMRLIPKTMLEQTGIGAVRRQIEYGKSINAPWGMSEAAYYRFDQHLNYQYRAIGVPGLGFSTELGKFLVIAPYATMLALNIHPKESLANIQYMRKIGAEGDYGLYEAIDFITPKNSSYRKSNVVKSFFAHHQGMSMISLSNFIHNKNMQDRFHKEPMIRATELLLEEKQPRYVLIRDTQKDVVRSDTSKRKNSQIANRVVRHTKPKYPIAHVLSNSHYTAMLTSTGSGMSWYNHVALNRWRADSTCDTYGIFFYVRNIDTRKYWSSTYQPTRKEPDNYEVVFSLDKAEYKRRDGDIDTRTEVTVSPQDSVEIRKVTLTNNGEKEVNLDVTSYFEVVIDRIQSDLAHPAFSKLFVETEYIDEKHTLLATRRPRESEKERKWLLHTVLVDEKAAREVEYETDRSKFLGRGKTLHNPDAMTNELNLSNSVGKVLDTVMSLRVRINIAPGKSKTVTYITGIADTRHDAMKLAYEYRRPHIIEDSFKLAQYHNEVEMQYLDITPQQASAVQDIVGSLFYPTQLTRGPLEAILNNRRSQTSLWRFGISGDHPIILLKVNSITELDTVRDVILAYEYLRMKGVKVDLVILNEQDEGYFQELSQKIRDLMSNIKVFDTSTRSSGAFLLQAGTMEKDEVTLLLAVARVVLSGKNRLLSKRLRSLMLDDSANNSSAFKQDESKVYSDIPLAEEELIFYNGIGGFTKEGKEYVITLKGRQNTPSPWSNVLANRKFGCNITASGSGYTWAVNSRENKLTKWTNDPVSDEPSEVIYIRDEATGKYFTPALLPVREETPYKVRHGFGYTTFEHNSLEIQQKTTVFVSKDDPVKFYRVNLVNRSVEKRRLSLTYYAEFVLGVARDQTAPFIVTDMDTKYGVMTAKNSYNGDFPNNVAFIFASEEISSYTGDRFDFFGTGCLSEPAAMVQKELGNKVGAGLDPCGAIKVDIELEPNQERDVVFALGEVNDIKEIEALAIRYRKVTEVNSELERVRLFWSNILDQIKVETPEKSMNFVLNGWLLYQTLSSRIMARSGFYQASGAYGFRDQLQDSMALLHASPDISREIILRHAGRQYLEGDVQHWWHDDSGRGVRTRVSDDLLWLPYAVAAYIKTTGDIAILDENSSYLDDSPLGPFEHDRFSIPNVFERTGSVYEHCIKVIDRSLAFGEHGLPFMGGGDWNDGMNKVGAAGKGESIWLGWFLYSVLHEFSPYCEVRGDKGRAQKYIAAAEELHRNIEKHSWDGEWYLRAFFDNGQSMGSRLNMECQIDSIAQSWAVISGGADNDRAVAAMEAVKRHLIREDDQISLLLAPPFDRSEPDPGYIRGYIPGIRENGGQYTHAAVWNIIAFAKLRKGNITYNLFKILNPINHALTLTDAAKYKNEPYVMSADVYSVPPHNGRGGWSWYTGAAGWMYQAGIEWILGLKKKGNMLKIDPTIPKEWANFKVKYQYKDTTYHISVGNPQSVSYGVIDVTLDGIKVEERVIQLQNDGSEHWIIVTMGKAS